MKRMLLVALVFSFETSLYAKNESKAMNTGVHCAIEDSKGNKLGTSLFYFQNDQDFVLNMFSVEKSDDTIIGQIRRDGGDLPFEVSITSYKKTFSSSCEGEVFISPIQSDPDSPIEFPVMSLPTTCEDQSREVYTLKCAPSSC